MKVAQKSFDIPLAAPEAFSSPCLDFKFPL